MEKNYNVNDTIDLIISDISDRKVELKTILSRLLFNINKFICKNPSLVCLGGVPGVGKSTYSKIYYQENYFIINPDDYRQFHPNYMSLNTSSLIQETNEFTSHISELLFRILTTLSCNIVIECTFANYNYWQNFLNHYSVYLSKYYRKLIFLSAPIDVCYQAMCCRHKAEAMNIFGPIPRPVKWEFLWDRAKNIKESVSKYTSSNLFNEIIFMHKFTLHSDFVQISHSDFLSIINGYDNKIT